jgi:ABC-type multidrug transport system permease subunit
MIQLIAELGGGAAVARFFLGMWSESQKRQRQDNESQDAHAAMIHESIEGVLEFIFCGMAVCSFLILLSPIICPLFFKNSQVVFLLSESRSFFFCDWSKLTEYSWGVEGATRKIVILPYMVATCTNFVSFFLTGRAMRIR